MTIIRELNKDTAYHRLTADLKASIEHEEIKKSLNLLASYLSVALDEFEGIFDNNEDQSYEIMEWYVGAANYMRGFGRKTDYIARVKEKMDELPFS